MQWKLLEGDLYPRLHIIVAAWIQWGYNSQDTARITQMNPNKQLQSSVDGRHWPCTESVDGLHRGTPDSGWLSVHTDPLMSLPQARGWSTTSSRLVLLSLWGCKSMRSSGWLNPGGKSVKWLCVKNWNKRETRPIFKQPHRPYSNTDEKSLSLERCFLTTIDSG